MSLEHSSPLPPTLLNLMENGHSPSRCQEGRSCDILVSHFPGQECGKGRSGKTDRMVIRN